MLAGVLLPLCLAPVHALSQVPLLAAPVVVVWALVARFARPWAVPAALVVAVAGILLTGGVPAGAAVAPAFVWTAPVLDPATLVGIGLPLFVVTMVSQNVTGMAVLAQYGFRPPWRTVLLATGAGTIVGAPLGGHAVNLAAISAALTAGPDAGPAGRRWIASVTNGIALAALGLTAGVATAVLAASPPVLVEAVAGLALLGALGSAIAAALAEPDGRRGRRRHLRGDGGGHRVPRARRGVLGPGRRCRDDAAAPDPRSRPVGSSSRSAGEPAARQQRADLRVAAAERPVGRHRVDGAAAGEQLAAEARRRSPVVSPPCSANHSTVSASSTSLQM